MTTLSKGAIGRGAIWSILNQAVGQFLVLAVFLVTARFVSKEAFGIIAVCMLVVEAFRQIWAESIGTSLTAKKDPTDQDYNACFLIIAAGGLLFSIIVFALAGPIGRLLQHEDIESSLRWIALLLVTGGLSKTHETWLIKHLQFKVLAFRSLVSICIGGGIGIVMAIQGYGIMSLIAQQLITAMISTVWLWAATEWRPRLDTGRENIVSLLRYSRHVSTTAAAAFANTQSDVFFSSFYLGPALTGVYNAAKRILVAITIMFSTGLNAVVLPTLAALSSDHERSARAYLKAVSMTTVMSAALFAGLAATAPDLIAILLGAKWADVAPVLAILAINGYVSSLSQYNTNVMLVKNKPHWSSIITIINASANILLFIVVARYGLLALATAYVAKNVVLAPLSTGSALYLLKINPLDYLKRIAPSIAAALIMAAAVTSGREYLEGMLPIIRLMLLVPAGGVLYVALMVLFDRRIVKEMLSMAHHTIRKA